MSFSLQTSPLDILDKRLLNDIQWTFPLSDRPFLKISENYGVSESEIIHRISKLKTKGLIRQINAIFDTRKLGYKSALIAFSVKPDKVDFVANEINRHPGVSHNYERNHEFNIWFTLAVGPNDDMKICTQQYVLAGWSPQISIIAYFETIQNWRKIGYGKWGSDCSVTFG